MISAGGASLCVALISVQFCRAPEAGQFGAPQHAAQRATPTAAAGGLAEPRRDAGGGLAVTRRLDARRRKANPRAFSESPRDSWLEPFRQLSSAFMPCWCHACFKFDQWFVLTLYSQDYTVVHLCCVCTSASALELPVFRNRTGRRNNSTHPAEHHPTQP